MEYKGFKIYANTKRYALWSVDEDGRIHELEHEFEGDDVISYTFANDEVLDGEYGDFETVEQTKQAIDRVKSEIR